MSFCDFLAKLDKKDKGKTKAALPRSIRPNNTELTATDVPGLHKKPSVAHELFFYYITKGSFLTNNSRMKDKISKKKSRKQQFVDMKECHSTIVTKTLVSQ